MYKYFPNHLMLIFLFTINLRNYAMLFLPYLLLFHNFLYFTHFLPSPILLFNYSYSVVFYGLHFDNPSSTDVLHVPVDWHAVCELQLAHLVNDVVLNDLLHALHVVKLYAFVHLSNGVFYHISHLATLFNCRFAAIYCIILLKDDHVLALIYDDKLDLFIDGSFLDEDFSL